MFEGKEQIASMSEVGSPNQKRGRVHSTGEPMITRLGCSKLIEIDVE